MAVGDGEAPTLTPLLRPFQPRPAYVQYTRYRHWYRRH